MTSVAIKENNWLAKLNLSFIGREDKTVINHRKHIGPLVIQKPFYPEGKVCHTYLLHPPGGVVGGDELNLNVNLSQSAHALITTPGATKFYRSDGKLAIAKQNLTIEKDSALEWFPQETILFSSCNINTKTKVNLQANAKFMGWEIICLGRPASNELFDEGHCRQCFEIWRDEQPLLLDRASLVGGNEVLTAKWGLQDYTAMGTFIIVGANKECLDLARECLVEGPDGLISVTLIDDVLVCRALAHQAEWIKNKFISVWRVLRPLILGQKACAPRIWST